MLEMEALQGEIACFLTLFMPKRM